MNGKAWPEDAKKSAEENLREIDADDKYRHIIKILHNVNAGANEDIFQDTDVIFDVQILGIAKHFRGHGLGSTLIKKSVELAGVLDFKKCKTEASGTPTKSKDA